MTRLTEQELEALELWDQYRLRAAVRELRALRKVVEALAQLGRRESHE